MLESPSYTASHVPTSQAKRVLLLPRPLLRKNVFNLITYIHGFKNQTESRTIIFKISCSTQFLIDFFRLLIDFHQFWAFFRTGVLGLFWDRTGLWFSVQLVRLASPAQFLKHSLSLLICVTFSLVVISIFANTWVGFNCSSQLEIFIICKFERSIISLFHLDWFCITLFHFPYF